MNNSAHKTDWTRLRREQEEDAPVSFDPEAEAYDPNNDQAVEAFWAPVMEAHRKAQASRAKTEVTVSLSSDVLSFYQAAGEGWQTRVDEALRKQMVEDQGASEQIAS
jgi:uncharacterized protein (DUF4415 family)